jgi:hypothetical protein
LFRSRIPVKEQSCPVREEHTNISVFTGVYSNIAGANGGCICVTESTHYSSPQNPAIVTIGATNVTFDGDEIAFLGGSAIETAWGSTGTTIKNSKIHDGGGSGITGGSDQGTYNSFRYSSTNIVQTPIFTASTPQFFEWTAPVNDDTGASGSGHSYLNNAIYNFGTVNPDGVCISLSGWQNYTIDHNTLHDCGTWGLVAGTAGIASAVGNAPPSYNGLFACFSRAGTTYCPFFGNTGRRGRHCYRPAGGQVLGRCGHPTRPSTSWGPSTTPCTRHCHFYACAKGAAANQLNPNYQNLWQAKSTSQKNVQFVFNDVHFAGYDAPSYIDPLCYDPAHPPVWNYCTNNGTAFVG